MKTGPKPKFYLCTVCLQSLRAAATGKLFPHTFGPDLERCAGSNALVDFDRAARERARRKVDLMMHQESCGYEDHGLGETVLAEPEHVGPHLVEEPLDQQRDYRWL